MSKTNQSTNSLSYSSDHWALQPYSLTNSNVIALAYFEQSDYAVCIHPEDKRGYRSIIRLIKNDQMISTINREYTSSERIGLALVMALVTEAYTRILPIAQNAVLGNNAHSFDPKTSTIQLGTSEEPIFLHGHVFGRGNPKEHYIENIPLDGPIPGMIFDLRAQSPHEPGNDKRVSWTPDEINKVVHRLKAEIDQIHNTYKAHGLTVITQNRFVDIYMVRHGETDWNTANKIQGHTDTQLNTKGKLQAQQLQEKFAGIDFTKVVSSDLIRARLTAELFLGPDKSTMIETSPLLRERCFGIWEGRSFVEFKSHVDQTINLDNMTQEEYVSFKWHDTIESYFDVYERIKTVIRSILISSSASEGPVLLLSHGCVMRAILYSLKFQSGYRWEVDNGASLKLRVHADGQILLAACEGVKMHKSNEIFFSF
ncbi:unnamed protein product [Rotaria socialis]|uniref:Fructose-2,6-bisphosphatase TIGAR n=1 Tax=Rotaria socialis TaxID=392032 RepID=A0A817LAU5_9BILA|nr:unnamed protein product [Rotaria socialis]CAF4465584.1 unnamed protein product [Rotaria socialis]